MDHVPMNEDYNHYSGLLRKNGEGVMHMGLTAEYLAMKYRIPRPKQDEFALRSHQLAAAATDKGEFRVEVIPTWGRDDSGQMVLVTVDQCIRLEASLEALSAVPPAFHPAGG